MNIERARVENTLRHMREGAEPALVAEIDRMIDRMCGAPGGHPRFHELLQEMAATHVAKGSDYSLPEDILSNLRSSEQMGVPAWLGTLIRLSDKFERLKNVARKRAAGEEPAVNESMADTLMDLASYALLIRILMEEEKK